MDEKLVIAVFGCGGIYKGLLGKLNRLGVNYCFDNNWMTLQSELCENIRDPKSICELDVDLVIITCKAIDEIKKQLIGYGLPEDKIKTYKDVDGLIFLQESQKERREKYELASRKVKSDKDILIISNEMTFSGAITAIYYMSKILINHEYQVSLISINDDCGMGKYFEDIGVNVLYERFFGYENKELWEYLDKFKIIFVNTMIYYEIVPMMKHLSANIVWWIHECDERCDPLRNVQRTDLPEKLRVLGVGKRAVKSIKNIWGEDYPASSMLYGIPDIQYSQKENESHKKWIFAVIGTLFPVKGQDVYINAISGLSEELRNDAEFWIIGRVSDRNTEKEVLNAAESKLVKYLGELSRVEMDRIYQDIDVVVVPSRRDTMPIVAAEAMMNRKICVVSDVIGTAEYINDGVNGFVFKKEDAEGLKNILKKIIMSKDQSFYDNIRNEARHTYEKLFSLPSFESNIIELFGNINN